MHAYTHTRTCIHRDKKAADTWLSQYIEDSVLRSFALTNLARDDGYIHTHRERSTPSIPHIHTYMHTHIHTYIDTHMHAYRIIHTHTYTGTKRLQTHGYRSP